MQESLYAAHQHDRNKQAGMPVNMSACLHTNMNTFSIEKCKAAIKFKKKMCI
jgi:hypothetical protein